MKCALEATAIQLQKRHPDLEFKTFPYGTDLLALTKSAQDIVQQNYNVVIGPLLSHEALVTAPIFKGTETVQFLPIASHPELTKSFPNAVRMISNSKHYAKLAVKYALGTGVKNNIFILANDSLPYSTTYRDQFIAQLNFQGYQGKVHTYGYLNGKGDFKTIVAQIRAVGAEFVYAPVYANDISVLYLMLAESGIKTRIFTHAGLFDAKNTLISNFSNNVQVHFNGIWDQHRRGENSNLFFRATANSCDLNTLKPWTFAAWDALDLALRTHDRYPKLRGDVFAAQAQKISFTGLLGPWRLDENRDPIRTLPVFSLHKDGMTLDSVVSLSKATDGWEAMP